jgi:ABC-type uncharacterized transport system permease subunit
MLERALGLSAPEPVGWNLDLAEAIYFLANFTHGIFSTFFFPRDPRNLVACLIPSPPMATKCLSF